MVILCLQGETVLNVADKDIVEYLEGMQEKERLRLASSNSVNVLVHSNTPLKRYQLSLSKVSERPYFRQWGAVLRKCILV